MTRRLSTLTRGLILAACCSHVANATPPPPREWAVATNVEFVGLSAAAQMHLTHVLMGAVELAHAFAPTTRNLFEWTGPRDWTKSMRLILTDSRRGEAGGARSEAFVTDEGPGHSRVTVILYVDRLILNADGSPNVDGVAHVTLELVGHVFGLVQAYLEQPVVTTRATPTAVPPGYAVNQIGGFLRRLMSSPSFAAMDPAMRDGFVRARQALARPPAPNCAPTLWATGLLPAPSTRH